MKLIIALLLACLIFGCSNDKRYFKYKNQKGPYIPNYLKFHPEKKMVNIQTQEASTPSAPVSLNSP